MTTRHELTYQIRYAVRLTQRTARLYRRVQTAGTFLSIIGGSATLSLLAQSLPTWLGVAGAGVLAAAGAMLIAMRPADKAAQNEADARRYLAIAAKAGRLSDDELQAAIAEAQQSDCPEIEPLRAVAYNDIVAEFGRQDEAIPLNCTQTLIAALA